MAAMPLDLMYLYFNYSLIFLIQSKQMLMNQIMFGEFFPCWGVLHESWSYPWFIRQKNIP